MEIIGRHENVYNYIDKLTISKTTINDSLKNFEEQKDKSHENIERLNDDKLEKEKQLQPLKSLLTYLSSIDNKLNALEKQYTELTKELVENKTSLEITKETKTNIKTEVLANKVKMDKKKILEEYFLWFDKFFFLSIVSIESHVLEAHQPLKV